MSNGIIIVDHGSRRGQSNLLLEEVAALFGKTYATEFAIVEPAHMELAEPSIESAFARCVERGAKRIVVCPFFLGPGKHWTSDIPKLTAAAASHHPGTKYHVAMPLGIDDLIVQLLYKRVSFCKSNDFVCDKCEGSIRCGDTLIDLVEGDAEGHPAQAHTNNHGQCASCPFVTQENGTIIDKRTPALTTT